jgi:hypothetical protein
MTILITQVNFLQGRKDRSDSMSTLSFKIQTLKGSRARKTF